MILIGETGGVWPQSILRDVIVTATAEIECRA
jgi:hypothetical protein